MKETRAGIWLASLRRRLSPPSPAERASRAVALPRSRDAIPRRPVERLRYYRRILPARAMPWALIVAVALGAWVFQQYLYTSGYFELRSVQVFGVDRLGTREVERLLVSDPDEPLNLLGFDHAEAARRLQSHPTIRRAVIRTVWPSHLDVMIQERRPHALLVTDRGMSLVDPEGVVYARAATEDLLYSGLPILTAAAGRTYDLGSALEPDFRDLAFLYAATFERLGGIRGEAASEIHWDPATGVTVVMEGGSRLLCGTRPPSRTLPMAEALAAKADGWQRIDYIELRVDSHVAWRPHGPAVPAGDGKQLARR